MLERREQQLYRQRDGELETLQCVPLEISAKSLSVHGSDETVGSQGRNSTKGKDRTILRHRQG